MVPVPLALLLRGCKAFLEMSNQGARERVEEDFRTSMEHTKRNLKISFADEVFTQYDLKLLRELCIARKERHRHWTAPRKERDSINKCLRLLNRTLDSLSEKMK